MISAKLILLLGFVLIDNAVSAQDDIGYGIYGTHWLPWVLENRESVSHYIYAMPQTPDEKNLNDLDQLLDINMNVLIMQRIHKSRKERWLKDGADPDRPANELANGISNTYAQSNRSGFLGITLDEENFWWRERGDYLNDLYEELKLLQPNLPIWQFFAEGLRTQTRKDRKLRFNIAADGYVFDEYRLPSEDYESLLKEYISQNKPVISILWGAGSWKPGSRELRVKDDKWWNKEGWKLFYEKTMINRKYAIPTVYFMFDIETEDARQRLVPSFISSDSCARAFVDFMFSKTLPTLFSKPFTRKAPNSRPTWIASSCPEH